MTNLLDVLPGMALRLTDVPGMLSRMWQGEPGAGQEAPSAFRASQMNLVLQFGLATAPEEALRIFDQAIEFAQVYPCRIVALCPIKEMGDGTAFLQAKLFSQCYIGASTRQMCCCEALMLGYPVSVAGFLENQVMVWLENDLPVYHWLHRVPARRIEELYLPYLKLCTRVVFDSCVEGPDYAKTHWPKPDAVMDLAFSRLLPARQSIGQFLSGFDPNALVDGLAHVECRYAPGEDGEAANLLHWQQECLDHCEKPGEHCDEVSFAAKALSADAANSLEVEWQYQDGKKQFLWTHAKGCDGVRIQANFGKGAVDFPQHVKPIARVKELAEALFF